MTHLLSEAGTSVTVPRDVFDAMIERLQFCLDTFGPIQDRGSEAADLDDWRALIQPTPAETEGGITHPAEASPLANYLAENAKHQWTGRAYGFANGSLYLDKDGNGHLCFEDADLVWEHDRGSEGPPYRTIKVETGELLELSGYIAQAFPAAPQDDGSPPRDGEGDLVARLRDTARTFARDDPAPDSPAESYVEWEAATTIEALRAERDSLGKQVERMEYSDGDAEHWRSISKNLSRQLEEAREALRRVIMADDEFRASMAPDTAKDPVTLACDAGRFALEASK